MSALREIGWRRAARFGVTTLAYAGFRALLVPPLRSAALRLFGSTVGADTIVHGIRFINLDRTGFRGLRLGRRAFLGDECLLDLADRIILEDHVTLATRVTILTHTNVGYGDHPLQPYVPSMAAPVTIREGAFVGACATILAGVKIGACAVVGAGAVVCRDVAPWTVVTGVPARVLRRVDEPRSAGVRTE